ncbi:hypothetical protein KC363_g4626 [Hortaea werneckii]|nr:hypothetical protein KC361_g2038 [Hortaea werneckii]KAI6884770.1 hypothetical protein KC325_g4052 [Hortaea werneckii]KAI6994384.1 hypothetical protein KC359_g4651 [Hortaea werneckii]KAI7146134.1 hypothetical protein KC344_g3898 [Hortaea werneckii]KAI7174931.1 hypothetical protein KC360_g4001 [Hortaea werneckii]
MDESALLARTGKKLRKSLKAFRVHFKQAKTRTQANSKINDYSSVLADLKSLQTVLKAHDFRIRALNKYNLRLRQRSLKRLLAGQLRRRPTIGVETSRWRMKRAMSEVEQELRREAVALQEIEDALLTALEHLMHSYKSLRSVERKEEFRLCDRLIAMAEKLQHAVEFGALDQELEEQVREHLRTMEPHVREARAWLASIKLAVLRLARGASEQGMKVARQTLLEEYF